MKKLIYSGDIDVQLQGSPALTFVEKSNSYATFDVIGFTRPVQILDFREASLRAIEKLLGDGRLTEFAPEFNKPAFAEIWEEENSCVMIHLHHPRSNESCRYLLWMAVGIGEEVPVYEYLYEKLSPIGKNRYALVSIYKRPFATHHASVEAEFPSVSATT